MEFYKKNPDIKDEVICVCGESIGPDTVVCGEKFRPFADPKTFPGIPPRLIKVELTELNQQQKQDVVEQVQKEADVPPRHMAPTTTSSFKMTQDGSFEIRTSPVVDKEPEKKIVLEKHEDLLSEVYGIDRMTKVFPGVTETNVNKILDKFRTLEDLKNASNADLRACGIKPGFYQKIRDKAFLLFEELNEA